MQSVMGWIAVQNCFRPPLFSGDSLVFKLSHKTGFITILDDYLDFGAYNPRV